MSQRNVLILERSSQNLKKMDDKGKVVLEGVFAEFGVENRNGRIYEEREYLPHLEYLKKDMTNGNLLGELDHPERFEVALGNVSHRITELWYDQPARQVKGRIEILDTPKGVIAKSLLEAGVPLSISSRAAGTVNEDKTVQIQQIYTYDLVAKPGFESAQLKSVTESAKARINSQMVKLNENANVRESHNISSKLGIVNENVSILDLTDKYPSLRLREEALALQKESLDSSVKNKNGKKIMNGELNEDAIQQWTVFFKNELSKVNEKLSNLERAILEGKGGSGSGELKLIKQYVEKLRKVQEDSLGWQGEIAKAVNEVATYADTLADKSNQHYALTKRIVETVDENAKVLNHTQDWVGNNAKVTNAIAETVDHNADMLNAINEWNEELAKGINALNEWGEEKAKAINDLHDWGQEKAKAINGIHEWTSDIAKNVNHTANWSEEMFGRAMSKEDAKKLVEYIELVAEFKKNPAMKKKLDEMLKSHSITGKPMNETMLTGITGVKGLGVITNAKTLSGTATSKQDAGKDGGVEIDKHNAIVSKLRSGKFSKGSKPKGLKVLHGEEGGAGLKTGSKVKGIMTLDTVKPGSRPTVKIKGDGPKTKNQNMKLDTKPVGKLKESNAPISLADSGSIRDRKSKLDEKLSKIISTIEKEKKVDESVKTDYPFTALLSESDRRAFSALSLADKKRVQETVRKNPTTDAGVIKALWENAIAIKEAEKNEPMWLSAAPREYRSLYDKAPDTLKESIKARSEFYMLESQYQINNFWETSGLTPRKEAPSLNEVFTAKSPKEADTNMDAYVSKVGEMMKRYQR